MYILGISGGFRMGYQDASAVLVENGKVIAAIEEERLSRIKYASGRLPFLAIHEVLKMGGIDIKKIDFLAFHGATWENEIDNHLTDYFNSHFGYAPPIKRYHHHDCHAASTFYASGFDDALILTLDNSGDGISTQIATGKNGKLEVIKRFQRNNSLGFYYSLLTQYCGFVKDSDEYKLMGLASYGDRHKFNLSWLVDFNDGELKLNSDFIVTVPPRAAALHRDEMNFNSRFIEKMGANRRIPRQEIEKHYKDVAASGQRHLEEVVLKMVKHFVASTGKNKICLAGGGALNCIMNQRLMNADFVQDFFVQPAANDAGIALGAAWLACVEMRINPVKPADTYLGSGFTNEQIKTELDNCGIKYHYTENPSEITADQIAQNKVVGWFQGRMEFGPRALGNRSILANATRPEMKKMVNQKIKFREEFRPFCPSVLQEDASSYFIGKLPVAPYMTIAYDVKENVKENVPAVTHVDGTARIQTVNEQQNSSYYALLKALKRKTGHGICLNTSFNLSHEPIACTPRDALASFYSCGLDALIIGNYIVVK
jgi:carbamoyltransferase